MSDITDLTTLSDGQLSDLRVRTTQESDRREILLTGLGSIAAHVRRYYDAGGEAQDIIDTVNEIVNQ